jgi:hypothetical protein
MFELIRKLLAQSEVSRFQITFYEHSVYEFSLQRIVLICTSYSLNELHSSYNEQLTFVRICFFANAEKYIHNTWGGEEKQTPPTLVPSLSAPLVVVMRNQMCS